MYNRFSILSPPFPASSRVFHLSFLTLGNWRVAAGSNRRNDSGLRGKKNKARNRGRFKLGRNYLFFFSTPPLPFLLHDSQAIGSLFISLFLLFCLLFRYLSSRWRLISLQYFLNVGKRDWKTNTYLLQPKFRRQIRVEIKANAWPAFVPNEREKFGRDESGDKQTSFSSIFPLPLFLFSFFLESIRCVCERRARGKSRR